MEQKDLQTESVLEYESVLADVAGVLETARHAAARSVNSVMTTAYWEIGRRLVEVEQAGQARADYGDKLVERLAVDLTKRFGRGFGRRNLFQMRSFFLTYQGKVQTLSGLFDSGQKVQTVSAQLSGLQELQTVPGESQLFRLPWSHYTRLLTVRSDDARAFYEIEALRGGWSHRQLSRQIGTQFYERTALSKNKAAMLAKGGVARPEEVVTAEAEIKDPYVLEFLGLKDEYSEYDLEEGLIQHLETFLLELGPDFTFVARQKRLRVGETWYRIDLLLYHRRLRCLVIIDLKIGQFDHADVGQMNLYVNYAAENLTLPEERRPIGLILCSEPNVAVARYALEGLENQILAGEYRLMLPDPAQLEAELARTRRLLENRDIT